ncbi:MAG: hypothetical protein HRT88_21665, partial [Lentisphaeraceae bacterium]|nr:hypothetical protein [Lentisphaeraceae bacterium]
MAIPALLANGLLNDIDQFFKSEKGHYYRVDQIILLMSCLTLGRVKCFNNLKDEPVGEWGRLFGLDRIPAAKTMYKRVNSFCEDRAKISAWCEQLSRQWLNDEFQRDVGVLYCDGRQKIYYGKKNKPPKRHVSRQRLCYRGQTEWWINDHAGSPIFMLSSPLTKGMIATVEEDLIPNIILDQEAFPTQEQLSEDPYLCCFKLVVDREGYSPDFFKRLWENHRIACQTYHKYPEGNWPKEEFQEYTIARNTGDQKVFLAERGTRLSNGLWVREVRKLNSSGHQTSIISTDYKQELTSIAADMFDRWSQENFFKYAADNFYLDHLGSHELEEIDPETQITNPAYSRLTSGMKSLTSKINRRHLNLLKIEIDENLDAEKVKIKLQKISSLQEEIELFENEKEKLKQQRKNTERKILFKQLPEEEKYKRFHQGKTQFINMIRIMAYRAETSMVDIFKANDRFSRDGRSVVQDLFQQCADLKVDHEN